MIHNLPNLRTVNSVTAGSSDTSFGSDWKSAYKPIVVMNETAVGTSSGWSDIWSFFWGVSNHDSQVLWSFGCHWVSEPSHWKVEFHYPWNSWSQRKKLMGKWNLNNETWITLPDIYPWLGDYHFCSRLTALRTPLSAHKSRALRSTLHPRSSGLGFRSH